MEQYNDSIANLAHIFLDSKGWEAYFHAVADTLAIEPIESELQAQGVPVRFELHRGDILNSFRQGRAAVFEMRVDGAATIRQQKYYGLPKGVLKVEVSEDRPVKSNTVWLSSCTFIRDFSVRVTFDTSYTYAEIEDVVRTKFYKGGEYVTFFETIDKPTGFIYTSLRRRFYEWFIKDEKIAQTPSLVGLKRLLHMKGVKGLGVAKGVRKLLSLQGQTLPSGFVAVTYGKETWVVVGSKKISYSLDEGATWRPVTVQNFSQVTAQVWTDVIYNGNYFVAVSLSGFAYSLDGVRWDFTTLPLTSAVGDKYRIAYGDINNVGTFVVAGTPKFRYSFTNFTSTSSIQSNASFTPIHSIAYGNGVFIATSRISSTKRSTDGINWVSVQFPNDLPNKGAIVYGNNIFVALDDGKTWYSSGEGISWIEGNPGRGLSVKGDIAYGNGIFVALGATNEVAYSMSGHDAWARTLLPVSGANLEWHISFHAGRFMAIESTKGRCFFSHDGHTWEETTERLQEIFLKQFSRKGRSIDIEEKPVNSGIFTCEVTRYSNVLVSGEGLTDTLCLRDLLDPGQAPYPDITNWLRYHYVKMKDLNVRRGDWQELYNHQDVLSTTYVVQGADKDMVMYDPNTSKIPEKQVVSINRDNYDTQPTEKEAEWEQYTTAPAPYVWDITQLPANDPRRKAEITEPYQIDWGYLNLTPGNAVWETSNAEEGDGMDGVNPKWPFPPFNFTPPDFNARNYVYPPDRGLDNILGNLAQKVIILSESGALGSDKFSRDRFILQEWADLSQDRRTIQGIIWDYITLNLKWPNNTSDPEWEHYPYIQTEELKKFVNFYIKEYCNWKIREGYGEE
jgi:hypothetical protein